MAEQITSLEEAGLTDDTFETFLKEGEVLVQVPEDFGIADGETLEDAEVTDESNTLVPA